jgi:hypothetical protein
LLRVRIFVWISGAELEIRLGITVLKHGRLLCRWESRVPWMHEDFFSIKFTKFRIEKISTSKKKLILKDPKIGQHG